MTQGGQVFMDGLGGAAGLETAGILTQVKKKDGQHGPMYFASVEHGSNGAEGMSKGRGDAAHRNT